MTKNLITVTERFETKTDLMKYFLDYNQDFQGFEMKADDPVFRLTFAIAKSDYKFNLEVEAGQIPLSEPDMINEYGHEAKEFEL